MILAFHGWTGDEKTIIGDKNVKNLSEERGYIIVAPRGLGSDSPDYSYNSWRLRGSSTGVDGT